MCNITKNDISNYCLKNNIPLTNEELDIIYYYIKNRYNDFLNGKNIVLVRAHTVLLHGVPTQTNLFLHV